VIPFLTCCSRLINGLLFLTLVFLFANDKIVLATHETDHRYTVFGVIKDSSGLPQSNIRVMVSDTLTGEGNTVFTDEKGYYEVLLHLHNNNLGDEIRISSGPVTESIKAIFNPEDKKTERKKEVNLVFPGSANRDTGKEWTVVAAILLGFGVLFLMNRLVRQRRLDRK
jgi:hypothetical protein